MVRRHVGEGQMTSRFSEGRNAIYAAHRDAVSGGWTDFPIPQDIGVGRICSLGTSGRIAACEHRMLFSRDVSFADEGPSQSINAGFCIGAEVEWVTDDRSAVRQTAASVGTDSLFIQSGSKGSHSIRYLQNLEYDFVSLCIPLSMPGRDGADGDVAQSGTHEELVAVPGIYRDMVEAQSRGADWLGR